MFYSKCNTLVSRLITPQEWDIFQGVISLLNASGNIKYDDARCLFCSLRLCLYSVGVVFFDHMHLILLQWLQLQYVSAEFGVVI